MSDTPRLFELYREEDETGVSGTGIVAHGVQFPDGVVAMRWNTKTASTTIYDNIKDAMAVHSHRGKTRIVWYEED
jgi:hypothetical protein